MTMQYTPRPASGKATSYTIQWRRGTSRGTITVDSTQQRPTSTPAFAPGRQYFYYRVKAHNSGGDERLVPELQRLTFPR